MVSLIRVSSPKVTCDSSNWPSSTFSEMTCSTRWRRLSLVGSSCCTRARAAASQESAIITTTISLEDGLRPRWR